MNKIEQNKFERLATLFHHEKMDGKDMHNTLDESGLSEDADFSAVKKIFDAKDLVAQAGKVSPPAEAWVRLHNRISRKRLLNKIFYWPYAAAVIAAILMGGVLFRTDIRAYFSEPEQFISELVPIGEIRNLTLIDGTEVWLNSGSRLTYSTRFDKSHRQVEVDGEAYFKVVKDDQNLFTVLVGNSKVIVHGTAFNVKSYKSEKKCEVVLIEGSVEYVNSRKIIFIEPGERITETIASGDLVIDHVDTEKFIFWISGKAYFEKQTLVDLVSVLEKWYEVEFEFANDTAKSYKFTGMINREQTLDYTLKIIEMTNKVKFVKKGGKMLITN